MVKRQTVWLSTMMVLSLMLIGYYTMNNGAQSTGAGANGSEPVSVTTPEEPAVTDDSQQGSGSDMTSQNANGQDFFANWQTTVRTNLSRSQDRDLTIIGNNSSTAEEIAQAQDDLKQLSNLQGGIESAQEAVIADGYQDCAIVPNADNTKLDVYVQTKKPLTALAAASIQYLVNQQLSNFPMSAIVVHEHK
ncbi:MAG: SpoIIIAH-like family protein [Alicyclobacillus sp.]|nr:SpoIIIAH-like family protein [Alicyclobacillus sp.]